ncbi:MAG: glutathione transferase GstA [Candidatus Accumulibacter sp.]|jgi:glutathione S-transferase|nr:glutathione transferase GstA [Accumulibacter sp.]
MKLYFSPGACSFSPHIALREAGLAFELVKVDLKTGKIAADGSDFARINPKGYVPALELDDGKLLTEGPAIVQYIADQKPESGLAPKAGTFERYRLQEWLGFINSEIHKGFGPLFNPATPEDYKAAARENLARRLSFVAGHLEQDDFLLGQQFSVADAYLYTVLNWTQWTGIDLSRWPSLAAFQERVGGRPSVKAARAAEAAA